MARAVLCPVCNGSGKLPPTSDTSDATPRVCHGCGGKGWVEVGEDFKPTSPTHPKFTDHIIWE